MNDEQRPVDAVTVDHIDDQLSQVIAELKAQNEILRELIVTVKECAAQCSPADDDDD